eukprot:3943841-Prymnesium_polylepis.1
MGNWELLGAMALLQPKRERLAGVRLAMHEEAQESPPESQREADRMAIQVRSSGASGGSRPRAIA